MHFELFTLFTHFRSNVSLQHFLTINKKLRVKRTYPFISI